MDTLGALYRPSLSLLTDLYQVTMAQAAWKSGADQREAVFHQIFRHHPHGSGFTVAAGLAQALEWVERFRFAPDDLAYLGTLTGSDGGPLFERGFLEHLKSVDLQQLKIDAVPEGTVVFPQEPLVRVQGPVVACMLLETALLNMVNFQTLIATKAARVHLAARGEPVLEFGLRRAQGIDGAIAASRAAFIGGAGSTSNVLAGKLFGIPVRGTHAHSWVMIFDDELEAFRTYADALPNNCVLLVDTYDTLEGVRRAIAVGRELKARGHRLLGVRLDSGDLAYLSIEARKLLDAAGFEDTAIYASSDLDEHVIASLKEQGAKISVWGVGTRLVTGGDDPALGGVYKLSAIRERGGQWHNRIKVADQATKMSTPGILQVRRYRDANGFVADAIYDVRHGVRSELIVDPQDSLRRKKIEGSTDFEDLLVPVFADGKRLQPEASLHELQARTFAQLALLPAGVKRFMNPHQYPAGLERELADERARLVLEAKKVAA